MFMLSQVLLGCCRMNMPTPRTKIKVVLENTCKKYGDSSVFKNCGYSCDAMSPLDLSWAAAGVWLETSPGSV